MYYHDQFFYRIMKQSEKDRYAAFISYLRKELISVTRQVFNVLGRGYDKTISADRDNYYNSEGYKKAKEKQEAEKKKNSGINEGIERMHQRLGHWVPAKKRPPGAYYHITYSTPDFDDELQYEPISLKNYVGEKAIKLLSKCDKSSLAGMMFDVLANDSSYYYNSEDFQRFCYNHFEESDFSLGRYMPEMYEFFPKSIEKGKIVLDRVIIVEDGTTVFAYIEQSQKYTTLDINLRKYPLQKSIIGKKKGETFKLPNIDLTYKIELIY